MTTSNELIRHLSSSCIQYRFLPRLLSGSHGTLNAWTCPHRQYRHLPLQSVYAQQSSQGSTLRIWQKKCKLSQAGTHMATAHTRSTEVCQATNRVFLQILQGWEMICPHAAQQEACSLLLWTKWGVFLLVISAGDPPCLLKSYHGPFGSLSSKSFPQRSCYLHDVASSAALKGCLRRQLLCSWSPSDRPSLQSFPIAACQAGVGFRTLPGRPLPSLLAGPSRAHVLKV